MAEERKNGGAVAHPKSLAFEKLRKSFCREILVQKCKICVWKPSFWTHLWTKWSSIFSNSWISLSLQFICL